MPIPACFEPDPKEKETVPPFLPHVVDKEMVRDQVPTKKEIANLRQECLRTQELEIFAVYTTLELKFWKVAGKRIISPVLSFPWLHRRCIPSGCL